MLYYIKTVQYLYFSCPEHRRIYQSSFVNPMKQGLRCVFLDFGLFFFPTRSSPFTFTCDRLQVEDSDMAPSGAEATGTGTETEQIEEDQPAQQDENIPAKKEAQVPKVAPKAPVKAKAAAASSSCPQGSQSAIAALFSTSGKGKSGGKGKGKRGGTSNKEVAKSDAVATDAGQLLQMFDEPSEIFGVSIKKMEDVHEKIKGRTGRSISSVFPSSKTSETFFGQGVSYC